MKKTLILDDKLLQQAKAASGATTDADTVRLALEQLVRNAAYEAVRTMRGMEEGLDVPDVPRRREAPSSKRKVA